MATNEKKEDAPATDKKKGEDTVTKEALKPITKVNSKLDKELQELEVESTKGGKMDGN